jgi:hypothetical protein
MGPFDRKAIVQTIPEFITERADSRRSGFPPLQKRTAVMPLGTRGILITNFKLTFWREEPTASHLNFVKLATPVNSRLNA